MYRKLLPLLAVAAALMGVSSPADAHRNGFVEEEYAVGFFYGTFNEDPNTLLLVGGRAEDFCANNPDDPFNGAPGSATSRVFVRSDGSVVTKVNSRRQPIHLYYIDAAGGPPWIEQVCAELAAGAPAPAPFASGTANLKVRERFVSGDHIEIFNAVRGRAVGTDGARYRVAASVDFILVNGMPNGDPEDFVKFRLVPIGR